MRVCVGTTAWVRLYPPQALNINASPGLSYHTELQRLPQGGLNKSLDNHSATFSCMLQCWTMSQATGDANLGGAARLLGRHVAQQQHSAVRRTLDNLSPNRRFFI